ncbi:hypothetical protein K7X08_027928 [Anisodus acutangulus]|uniref:Uncharacterized protein n=1 Tax=Anisodus acutangulus TaxID=402998 RepID=A0A9Q1RQW1_9SOLA|nr:hypothetical protein K7X08_027928 [Anisodus acutangulus]
MRLSGLEADVSTFVEHLQIKEVEIEAFKKENESLRSRLSDVTVQNDQQRETIVELTQANELLHSTSVELTQAVHFAEEEIQATIDSYTFYMVRNGYMMRRKALEAVKAKLVKF